MKEPHVHDCKASFIRCCKCHKFDLVIFCNSNDEPVALWEWINELLESHEIPRIGKNVSFERAMSIGRLMEAFWKVFRLKSDPPMTRFVASELAKDHWFNISAAKRDLSYRPRVSMKQGMEALLNQDDGQTIKGPDQLNLQ